MQLLNYYDFKINDKAEDVLQRYPNLPFSVNLNINNKFYVADVTLGFVNQNLRVAFYDDSNILIQPYININNNINLFFCELGYTFLYNNKLQRFELFKD